MSTYGLRGARRKVMSDELKFVQVPSRLASYVSTVNNRSNHPHVPQTLFLRLPSKGITIQSNANHQCQSPVPCQDNVKTHTNTQRRIKKRKCLLQLLLELLLILIIMMLMMAIMAILRCNSLLRRKKTSFKREPTDMIITIIIVIMITIIYMKLWRWMKVFFTNRKILLSITKYEETV